MARRTTALLPDAIAAFVTILWLGALIGVSFLATPVKFQATLLDLPTALEVGRVTFAAFSKLEWGLSLVLLLTLLLARAPRLELILSAIAVAVVAVQALWLLPVLNIRIEAIIAGEVPAPSMHHLVYVISEAVKALALLAAAVVVLRRLGGWHLAADERSRP